MDPDRERYLDEWSRRHGGYDPRGNTLARSWLSLMYAVGRPVARTGLSPHVVSIAGVAVAALALWPADAGDAWLAVAAALVVLAAIFDGVDGAVAVLGGKGSAFGAVLDGVADRIGDLLFLGALVLAGSPLPVAAAGGALMMLHEYLRAAARAEGMTGVGVVTVAERPTRVIVTAAFLLAGAVVGDPWPELGAWAWAGIGIVGLAQLLPVVRRGLNQAGMRNGQPHSVPVMTTDAFVPVGFDPPTSLVTDRFRLEPLGPQHNMRDHAAWTSSIEHIRATPGYPDGKWPPLNGMSLEENLADLRRHAGDFTSGKGFTFTVLEPADDDVIGCVYVYPTASPDYDVTVQSWVRADRADLDVPLADAVASWLAADWPWDRVDRCGR